MNEQQHEAKAAEAAHAPRARAVPPPARKAKDKDKAKKMPLSRELVLDGQTEFKEPPPCADRKPARLFGEYGYFVPVLFVANDWKVTTRRIRALLASKRLVGQLQANGYWEVRYPYIFTIGTRGPSLKRQQKPEKRLKLVVDNVERRPE